jgi:hypothetical protein
LTPLAPLTLLLTGGMLVAGVVPVAEVAVVLAVLGEDSGGSGTVTLDPIETGMPGVVAALHGPAIVLTTGGVFPAVPPTICPGMVVVLWPGVVVVAPGIGAG